MKYIIEFDYEPDEFWDRKLDEVVKQFLLTVQDYDDTSNVRFTMHEEVK